MTYQPHILLQFSGSLYTDEIWSCGLRIRLSTVANNTPEGRRQWAEDNLADLSGDVQTWFVDTDSQIAAGAKLLSVKLNPIGADGRYESSEETIEQVFVPTPGVTGAAGPYPPQVTTVLSLKTSIARGAGSNGRIFAPTGALTIDPATGRIAAAMVTAMAGSFASFIESINDEAGLDDASPQVVVASNVGSPGPMQPATSIRVGNVVDTQRRRRNALPENYTTVALAAP